MRKRGAIFKNFKDVEVGKDDAVSAIAKMNENQKLIMELLADLRVNTSDDPKKLGEGRPPRRQDSK